MNFNGFHVLALLLQRHRSPEVNQTLHDVWSPPGLVHDVYIFAGSCPEGIFPGAKFTLRPSLAFSYVGSLLHGTPAVGISQTLQCGTRNAIMELSQRVPPILGWAAITLDIGPHSSFVLFLLSFLFFLVFSSPNLSGRRLDVYHTSTHGVT